VPLWVASGSGAQARVTLGTVVIGGMLGATCVDTLIVPVTFYIVEKLGGRFHWKSIGGDDHSHSGDKSEFGEPPNAPAPVK